MPYGTYFPSRSTQGRTLGIVGLMLSIIPSFTIGGIILSIIALVESRRAKVRNVPAVVGICVGALYLLIGIGVLVFSLYSAPGNPVS